MIFNKSYIVLNKGRGLTHPSPWLVLKKKTKKNVIIKHFAYKMKTFAVDNTVIFVTEVIFLGINCTFLS